MTPSEIAEKMSATEYTLLCHDMEALYHQKFGVVSVRRTDSGTEVIVELENETRHTILIKAE